MSVVSVNNVTKLYKIGGPSSSSLRDAISGLVRRSVDRSKTELWALKDVSFEVGEGDTLGIIGRNGAGKSTLLKILSRITKPTSGSAEIRGRVGSLLEVGTGFHNELTGRENVYLSGAILGMRRVEIEKRFDEIVAFSEIEQFLDTPVKHYSSGMYMRLAFSVAAHLEPEVLIVDEVLAVGDSVFQNKCLGKIGQVSRSGRTVLFVSHNLGSLAQICNRGILLNKGELVFDGAIAETVSEYIKLAGRESTFAIDKVSSAADLQITGVALINADGENAAEFTHREYFDVSINLSVRKARRGTKVLLALLNKYKRRVFTVLGDVNDLSASKTGDFRFRFRMPADFLAPNNYSFLVQLFYTDGEVLQQLDDICSFDVIDVGSEMAAYQDYGYIQVKSEWQIDKL